MWVWLGWQQGQYSPHLVEIDGQRISFITETEEAGVGEAFVSFIGDDVIDRLVAVSPYWDDDLHGLEQMRESLGSPASALVVEIGEHDFSATTFQSKTGLTLHSTSTHAAGGTRRLHAKLLIACGQEADYILSGSANISEAGLFGRFNGAGNAEACIMRTEPAGAVIDRLDLSVCLSEEMPLSHLRPRMSGAVTAENEPPAVPDGGAHREVRSEHQGNAEPQAHPEPAPADVPVLAEGAADPAGAG